MSLIPKFQRNRDNSCFRKTNFWRKKSDVEGNVGWFRTISNADRTVFRRRPQSTSPCIWWRSDILDLLVQRWFNDFQRGRVSLQDEPRRGLPNTGPCLWQTYRRIERSLGNRGLFIRTILDDSTGVRRDWPRSTRVLVTTNEEFIWNQAESRRVELSRGSRKNIQWAWAGSGATSKSLGLPNPERTFFFNQWKKPLCVHDLVVLESI